MAMPCSLVVAAFAQLMQRVDRWPDLHFEAGLAWQHARSGYGGIAPALASLPPGFSQVALVNDASQLWCEKHPAAKCRTECTVLADAGPDSQCVNISYPDTEQNRSGGTHDLHYLIPPLFEASRQGARILVGPYTSSMANFLAPIAVALGVALIAPTVTSAELTEASELRQKRPTPSSQQPSLVRSGLRAYRSSAPPPLESSKRVQVADSRTSDHAAIRTQASNGFTSFSRVAPSDALAAHSLVQALASFGWRSVGVAYPNDSFGRAFASSLREASATLRASGAANLTFRSVVSHSCSASSYGQARCAISARITARSHTPSRYSHTPLQLSHTPLYTLTPAPAYTHLTTPFEPS